MNAEHREAILRRAARGYIMVTKNYKGSLRVGYFFDDGEPVRDERRLPITETAFRAMIKDGALIPVKGENLLGDDEQPQRYRVRSAGE